MVLQGFVSKGTTKSWSVHFQFVFIPGSFHDEFPGRAGLLPVDAKARVNQRLLGIGQTWLADLDDSPVLKR